MLLAVIGRSAAVTVAGLVILIAGFLLLHAQPALREIGFVRFFADASWNPSPGPEGRFDIVPALVGSALATALAALIAVPIGITAALGSTFFVHRAVARLVDSGVGVLAGLPSVVIGLWGLTALVPWIARIRAPGASLLAAALVLAVMVVPTIYVASRGAFKSIPKTCLDGATALGMTRIGILRAAVLPTVKPALAVGAVLAITRALGETMAVVMVAGNVAAIPRSLFDPVRTLTANIALELPYATGLHRSALFAGGAGLMALTWSLVVLGRCISRAWSGEHND